MFRSSSSSVCKDLQHCSCMQSERYLQKFIKWCNTHVQLTTWVARCNGSEHDEVGFQLAAADFGSNSLWQTSYLKDNSWMSILHQYHKASRLKAWTAMCQSEDTWGNIFKMAGDRFVVHVFSAVWGVGGYCCSERIWNNYVEIHRKSMQVIFIILLCTGEYNSLGDPTRQHKADAIERLTACVLAANTNKTQLFNISDPIWSENDQNEMKLHGEYDYECIRNSLSFYPVLFR